MIKRLIYVPISIYFIIIFTIFTVSCGGNDQEVKLKREILDKTTREKLTGLTIKSVDRINTGNIIIWFTNGSHVIFKNDYHNTIEFTEVKN